MNIPRFTLVAAVLAASLSAGAQTASTKTYIVELADAPAATYGGGVAGLAATRPGVGAKLDAAAPNVRAYTQYLAIKRSAELARLGAAARPLHHYAIAFNGFAVQLTDAQAAALKSSAGVRAVTESQLVKGDTSRTPAFLGLTAPGGLWSQLDTAARSLKGEDIIIGVIDTGIWPENASFGDKVDAQGRPLAYHQAGTVAYTAPPAKWKGACVAGEGFTTAMCNNKLIGARFYGDAWLAGAAASKGGYSINSLEFKSPRDGGGHGSHTASTAGGNDGVAATIDGVSAGTVSGMAPRARIASYKVLWTASDTALGPTLSHDGGESADILKAIDDAVADGVDVINYSVSGTKTNFNDAVEIAYLNATAAGVFVAASAGNSGPGNEVAHISPWLLTVAASTHDRFTVATVTLGAPSGAAFSGPSYQGSGLSGTPMIRSIDAGVVAYASLTQKEKTALERCYLPADGGAAAADYNPANMALDPAKVAGKLVVCYRGGNVLINKAEAVKTASGAAMIIQNVPAIGGTPASSNTTVLQPYRIPTVHLTAASYSAINAYIVAQGASASASFAPAVQQAGVVAPVMASFSSRGPNKANANILKPDISGPGVDIIAGYHDGLMTQAQRDATVAGTFTPNANYTSLQGTSMSAPHLAGIAALLKQQHPSWSPAAIKSALMTSTTGIKLASGAPDPDRWGYGAGHVNPNLAGATALVYDASPADYGRFLCGLGSAPPAGIGSCATLGTIAPYNLNLASITAASVPGSLTVVRRVTNVSTATRTFLASTGDMPGWSVVVAPASLTLAPGASASFNLTFNRTTATLNTWSFSSLTWTDGVQSVVSPLSAKAVGFSAPALVSDTRPSGTGTKVFGVVSSYTGTMAVSAVGLVPATRDTRTINSNEVQCFNTTVPAGALVLRYQLFDADTQGGGAGTDLDLDVFNGPDGTGTSVGSSGGSTSSEVVNVSSPAASVYSACVTGFAAAGGKQYTLSSWVVGPAAGAQTLRAAGPRQTYVGGTASIALGWSVPAGKRYLGTLQYFDTTSATPALIGASIVLVDNR